MDESKISMQLSTGTGTLPLRLEPPVSGERPKDGVRLSTPTSALFRYVFSFPAMLASLLVGVVFVQGRLFNVDPDLWWHIKVGETILATHHWPTADTYSFTVAGQPWFAYEWLGDVLLAVVNRIGGVLALDLLLIVLGSTVALALYAFATLRSGNSKAGFVSSAALLLLASVSFSLRPQMLGYLFLILTLIGLERFRQGQSGGLWFLPALMLLWVNTHGSWIIGLGAIFVYWTSGFVEFEIGSLKAKRWTEGERRRIGLAFLLCLLVLPITPYGTRIAASPFEFAFSLPLNVATIQEWQSMPFHTLTGKLFLALILGVILLQVMARFTWRVEEIALFMFGTMMACLHVRFLLIFVPFFAPMFGFILAHWIPKYDPCKDKFALNAALVVLVWVGIIHYFPSRAELQKSIAEHFPVSAIDYLQRHHVPGPMYNTYGFGGFLVWSRGPEYKVFIDGRGDVYERGGLLADYLHISRLRPGALVVLGSYGVRSCLLQRDEPLATALSESSAWQRIYVDNVSALFVRRAGRDVLASRAQ